MMNDGENSFLMTLTVIFGADNKMYTFYSFRR